MKTRLLVTFGAALLSAALLHAQSATKLSANVPFDFQVGAVDFAAGTCEVYLLMPGVVRVTSSDHKKTVMVIANPTESTAYNQQARLIFQRYGDSYFLSQVWPDGTVGRRIVPGRRQIELASNKQKPLETELLARRVK